MLSIGWTEMMLVAAIALIVVGPKDLPALLRQVGKFAGQVRRMGNDFKSELNKVAAIDDVKEIKKSFTAPLTDLRKDAQKTFNAIAADGSIKPSGAISPRDPNSESVVDEIRDAAGLPVSVDAAGAAAKKSTTEAVRKAKADSSAANAVATKPAKPATRKTAKTTAKTPGKAKSSPAKPKAAAARKAPTPDSTVNPTTPKSTAKPAPVGSPTVTKKATGKPVRKAAASNTAARKSAEAAAPDKKPTTRKGTEHKAPASRKPRATRAGSTPSGAEK